MKTVLKVTIKWDGKKKPIFDDEISELITQVGNVLDEAIADNEGIHLGDGGIDHHPIQLIIEDKKGVVRKKFDTM